MVRACGCIPFNYPGEVYDRAGLTHNASNRAKIVFTVATLSLIVFGAVALACKDIPSITNTQKIALISSGSVMLGTGVILFSVQRFTLARTAPRQRLNHAFDIEALDALLANHREGRGRNVRSNPPQPVSAETPGLTIQESWTISGNKVDNPTNEYKCSLSLCRLAELDQPCFVAEDGGTYELALIKQSVATSYKSPNSPNILIGTLVNYASWNLSTCPISKKPFKQAYFCVEDGYNYELDALIKYVNDWRAEPANKDKTQIPSPGNPNRMLTSITVYPNKALFDTTDHKNPLPSKQEPLPLFPS